MLSMQSPPAASLAAGSAQRIVKEMKCVYTSCPASVGVMRQTCR
jgi:hypothetical protein